MNCLPTRNGFLYGVALLGCLALSAGTTVPGFAYGDPLSFVQVQDTTQTAFLADTTQALDASAADSLVQAFGSSLAHWTSTLSFENRTRPILDVFFLGLFLFLSLLLFFGWRLHRDLRPLSLALLSSAVALQVLVVAPLAKISSTQHAIFVLLMTGFISFALATHFPYLFRLRLLSHRIKNSTFYQESIGKAAESTIPMWLCFVHTALLASTIVLAALMLLAVITATFHPLAWSFTLASFFLPLLMLIPVVVLLVLKVQARRFGVFGVVLVLVSGFALLVSMSAAGTSSPLLYDAFYLILLGAISAQILVAMRQNVKLLRLGRRRVKELLDNAKEHTDSLKELMIKAQAASVAKTQFVSSVSHELRTPLTAIRGYVQILQEELSGNLDPLHEEFLETIEQSCERLTSVVNDLLDMAKVESGRVEMKLENVQLRPLIDETVAQLFPLANTKGILLLRPRIDSEDPVVHADALRLRQILINLLSNAIKFTEAGCVGVCVNSAVLQNYQDTLHAEPAYTIEVFDTGAGIEAEFLDQVFEPFTQEERVYSNTQRGTGLGLSITRELVERMGGQITVASEVNHGTKFTVVLVKAEEGSNLKKQTTLQAA